MSPDTRFAIDAMRLAVFPSQYLRNRSGNVFEPMKPTVVLFSIDGMRPDGLLQANTPNIDRLMSRGAYTMRARSVMPSVTLPCHTSMMRGVDVPRHGITTNIFTPLARPVPSLFDVAHDNGLLAGSFYNWGELRDLCNPWSLKVNYMVNDSHDANGDWNVALGVAEYIEKRPLDLIFVYLGCTDSAGHDYGWMSEPYIAAIGDADRCIGRVLEALTDRGHEVIAFVGTDHGGHDRHHGTEADEDMTIPWMVSGPGIPAGEIASEVRIYDTAPTIASLLGLPLPREWDGRPIPEVVGQLE